MQLLDNKDRVGCLLILVFALAYLHLALGLPVDPTNAGGAFTSRTLPIGLSVSAIAIAVFKLCFFSGTAERVSTSVAGFRWRAACLLVLTMTLYSTLFEYLGFVVASVLFLLAGFAILGEKRIWLGAVVAAGTVLGLWVLLTQAFGLYLDPGTLFQAFRR